MSVAVRSSSILHQTLYAIHIPQMHTPALIPTPSLALSRFCCCCYFPPKYLPHACVRAVVHSIDPRLLESDLPTHQILSNLGIGGVGL